ncbi:MAG: dephospho-CoA kinase [Bacteroidetes bacterium]|nr:dephospho-CoA kinase [Bacteroidota bacterium]
MLNVGITGGIGSGKTTVCRFFEALGVPVYNSDERAKYLMNHEHFLIDQIQKYFGTEAYIEGTLNRKWIAEKVFGDKKLLAQLNALVHPAVYRDTERWMKEQSTKNVPYTLREAALLVETGSYKSLDKLIVVTAPLVSRLSRITQRDQVNEADMLARVKNQMEEKEKVKLADFVIKNDRDLAYLEKQVQDIHASLVKLSQKKRK